MQRPSSQAHVGPIAQSVELTFDSDIEVVTPQLEKIQFTKFWRVPLSRQTSSRAPVGGYGRWRCSSTAKQPGSSARASMATRNSIPAPSTSCSSCPQARAKVSPCHSETFSCRIPIGRQGGQHIGRGVKPVATRYLAFRNFDTDGSSGWWARGHPAQNGHHQQDRQITRRNTRFVLKAGQRRPAGTLDHLRHPPAGAKSSGPMLSLVLTNCRRAHRKEEINETRHRQVHTHS